MTLDVKEILSQLDPDERKRIDNDLFDILQEELPRLANEEPGRFNEILADLAANLPPQQLNEVIQFLTAQAKKKENKNNSN